MNKSENKTVDPVLQQQARVPSRILVVEDDQWAGRALRTLLEASGFTVELAVDIDSALSRVNAVLPDIVITDLDLGADDGCDLARSLRATPSFQGKIVAMTGHCSARDCERMQLAGMDARFEKPLDFPSLRKYLSGQ